MLTKTTKIQFYLSKRTLLINMKIINRCNCLPIGQIDEKHDDVDDDVSVCTY